MEITTAKIVNSSPVELVVISYEIIIDDIDKNIKFVEDEKDTNINVDVNLNNAKNFIKDLTKALDMNYEISKRLKVLYAYTTELLIASEITKNNERKLKNLNDARKIMNILYVAWKKISDEEIVKEKSMDNVDVIYEGLTYGKTGLNETVLGKSNKGLKA